MTFEVRLGADVVSRDFKRLGKVSGLVVDPDHMTLLEIIVHEGFLFTTDRIVDMLYVDRIDSDGTVYLTVDAEQAEELPPLVTREYAVSVTADRGSIPWAVGAGPSMNQPIMWRGSAVGRSMQVSNEAGYLVAVAEAAPVEVRSDLPVGSVRIDGGTDVLAADGEKVGTVDDVVYNEDEELIGFIVKAGFFSHRDIEVPISHVAAITRRYVRLNVGAEKLTGW